MTGQAITGDVAKRLAEIQRSLSLHALHFAAHAALPVAVDSQLLHLIRVNFFLDPPEELSYQVEAKLLLSPVFREAGDGLYEMDSALRNALLSILQRRYSTTRIRQVATLLNQYTERSGAWSDQHELERAQQLTALNFLDPLRARTWLEEAVKTGGTEDLQPEWFVAMRGRLERTHTSTESLSQRLLAVYTQLQADVVDRERSVQSIWTLGELGQLADADRSKIAETLILYMRRFAPLSPRLLDGADVELDIPRLAERAPDIQAAITVLCAAVTDSVANSESPPSRMLAGIDLRRADFSGIDLSVLDFSDAFLQGADLQNATLLRTNLTKADLRNADLHGVVASWANFSSAIMGNSNLQMAKLRGADFTHANLDGANLSNAVLEQARLEGASLVGAQLRDANLRGANLAAGNLTGASLDGASLVDTITDLATRFPAELRLGELGLTNLASDAVHLSAEDVHNVAFSKPPIGKPGYNEDGVDAFLDLVEEKFRNPAANSLTSHDVRNIGFSKPPIGKRGYNEDEVDAFLDIVEAKMKAYELPVAPSVPPLAVSRPPLDEPLLTAHGIPRVPVEVLRSHRARLSKTTRLGRGYNKDEVDSFFDIVEAHFRNPAAGGLTARDVRNVVFSRSPLGGRGYVEREVDALLEFVEAELERYGSLVDPPTPATAAESPVTGRPAEVLAAYEHVLDLYRASRDRRNEAVTLIDIGDVHSGLGDLQRALSYYQQALRIQRDFGDRAGEVTTLNGIGNICSGLRNFQEALDCYQNALRIIREVGDRAGEAATRYSIAMIYHDLGRLDLAIGELEGIVDLDRQVAHPDLQSHTAMLEQLRQEWRHSHPEPM